MPWLPLSRSPQVNTTSSAWKADMWGEVDVDVGKRELFARGVFLSCQELAEAQ